MIVFLGGVYNLFLFSMSQQGKGFSFVFSSVRGWVLEFFVLFLHWFPLNIAILFI